MSSNWIKLTGQHGGRLFDAPCRLALASGIAAGEDNEETIGGETNFEDGANSEDDDYESETDKLGAPIESTRLGCKGYTRKCVDKRGEAPLNPIASTSPFITNGED